MQGPEKAAGSEIGGDKKIPGLGQVLSAAFWDDPTDVELLQEPVLSWHLARPGLFLAALLMVGLTSIRGIVGNWSIVEWFEYRQHCVQTVPASLPLQTIPLHLPVIDLRASGAVALIIP